VVVVVVTIVVVVVAAAVAASFVMLLCRWCHTHAVLLVVEIALFLFGYVSSRSVLIQDKINLFQYFVVVSLHTPM